MKASYCSMLLSIGLCTLPVAAQLVVFENPGAFPWHLTDPFQTGQVLDPTQGPSQTGAFVPHGFIYWVEDPITSTQGVTRNIWGQGQSFVARGSVEIWFSPTPTEPYSFFPAAVFQPGQFVGPTEDWGTSVPLSGYSFSSGEVLGLGSRGTIGISFTLASGTHYGWIDLVWTSNRYHAERWAYESTPGTPALVPAPGALALLGFTTLAWMRRRR